MSGAVAGGVAGAATRPRLSPKQLLGAGAGLIGLAAVAAGANAGAQHLDEHVVLDVAKDLEI